MKKTKRGTPEKLVCEFCGAVKEEITFMIGACSKPGADWCMIYGTGKMACPACYAKGTAEAEAKINRIITPAPVVVAVPAAAERAAVQDVEAELLPAKPEGLIDIVRGMNDHAAANEAIALNAPVPEDIAPGSFESKDAADALRPILDRVIKSVYLPDYRAKVTDAEALGVLIAKFFKWDGNDILAAAYSALEDANYHADNRIIERMQKGEDVDALIKDMAKELSAMHSQYCKDCAGGCPTLELIKRAKGE